jgi:hypothetical protein
MGAMVNIQFLILAMDMWIMPGKEGLFLPIVSGVRVWMVKEMVLVFLFVTALVLAALLPGMRSVMIIERRLGYTSW